MLKNCDLDIRENIKIREIKSYLCRKKEKKKMRYWAWAWYWNRVQSSKGISSITRTCTHMSYCSQHRRKAGKWGGGSRNLVIISKIDVIEEMLILVRVLCRLFEDINILLLEKNILLSDKLIMFLKFTNYYKEKMFFYLLKPVDRSVSYL